MGPMEPAGRYMEGMAVKFTPAIGIRLLIPLIQACLGLWLELLRPMASPNGPNGGLKRCTLCDLQLLAIILNIVTWYQKCFTHDSEKK